MMENVLYKYKLLLRDLSGFKRYRKTFTNVENTKKHSVDILIRDDKINLSTSTNLNPRPKRKLVQLHD